MLHYISPFVKNKRSFVLGRLFMADTIENVNRKIKHHIELLLMILLILLQLTSEGALADNIQSRMNELNGIQSEYDISTVDILTDYYSGNDVSSEFSSIIMSSQYVSKINDIGNLTRKFHGDVLREVNVGPITTTRLSNMIRSLSKLEVNLVTESTRFQICECNATMSICDASQMSCSNCGKIRLLDGTTFDSNQQCITDDDHKNTTNGGYSANKHYKFWTEKIYSEERKDLTDDEETKINDGLNQCGLKTPADRKKKMKYTIMRKILKEKGLTHLNSHTSFLMKRFSGPFLEPLTFNEKKTNAIIFDKIVNILDMLYKGNRPYYPFFILQATMHQFRILDTDDDNMVEYKKNRLRVMFFIHLQNDSTVRKHDTKMKNVCEYHNKHYPNEEPFVYKPTNCAYINDGILDCTVYKKDKSGNLTEV